MGLMATVCYIGVSVMFLNVYNCIVIFNVNICTLFARRIIRISVILLMGLDLNILIYLLIYY